MAEITQQRTKRALSLDALRGFAILTMVLSGTVPYKGLPAWMYHAQLPPPDRAFDPNLPGLTWVDLVFPFFLFALGAAIPLALGKKTDGKHPKFNLISHVIGRGFLLGFFAIFLRHVRPHVINPQPDIFAWLIAILGFILMFGLFTRYPEKWTKGVKNSLRAGSWIITITLLALLRYPDGSSFSPGRSDIILIVLTNAYVFGALIWLFTKENILLRIGVLGILLALRLGHLETGWVEQLWKYSPIPWIYQLYYLQYLFIVIPGTIIGDMIVRWMRSGNDSDNEVPAWTTLENVSIVILMLVIIVVQLVGLQVRWITETVIATILLIAGGWFCFRKTKSKSEQMLKNWYAWGTYLLITGLLFEPFEGGIKKDHSTLSYYFITAGLAVFMLIALFIIIDILNHKNRMKLLIANGQNPMIAYVGFANFIWPMLALTGLEDIIMQYTANPWLGTLRGLTYTILLAFMVQFFTKRKIYWRT